MWRKTRKTKSLIHSFIEEARFRRTGEIFLRFSDKRRKARSEHEVWVMHGKRSTKKRTAKPPVTCNHTNCSDTGGDYNKHGFTLRQHFLQRNDSYKYICFYGSETYKKVIYLNVNKSLQLFWCFQMRMRTNFVNLVRPSGDKSHKWYLSHSIVYSFLFFLRSIPFVFPIYFSMCL